MCGLAGEFLYDDSAVVDRVKLESMTRRIKHRGPEAEGMWVSGNVGFSHVRLKLSDPAHGIQPMHSARGTVLAYVGEIYNNAELRAELSIHGYPFQTTSDTEVLLAAYEIWGTSAWSRLNGMFAFAIRDSKSRAIYLVRDRFGIKPLYYCKTDCGVEFGSEPAGWISNVEEAEINKKSLLHFLQYAHTTLDDKTLLNSVCSVIPGNELCLTSNGIAMRAWWNPGDRTESYKEESEFAVAAKLRHLLHLAVGRQITADAPVGAFLSGGVDSAILVAMQSQMQREKVNTFSVALAGDEDDLRAARIVSGRWRTNHTELRLTPDDFFRAMDELIEIRRMPLALPNEVLIYALSRAAAKHVKAVLSGEGADELFGGYSNLLERLSRYDFAYQEQRKDNPLPLAALKAEMTAADFRSEAHFLKSCYSWFTQSELKNLINPSWFAEFDKETNFEAELNRWNTLDSANRFHLWLEYAHLPHLLSRLDGATMAASLEGRVPFTDTALVDYVTSLPARMKYHPAAQSKRLLRETFSDLLPPQIIGRTKKAFHASLPLLFESREGKRRLAALVENPKLRKVFCTNSLERSLSEDTAPQNYLKTWLMYSLSSWMERNM